MSLELQQIAEPKETNSLKLLILLKLNLKKNVVGIKFHENSCSNSDDQGKVSLDYLHRTYCN